MSSSSIRRRARSHSPPQVRASLVGGGGDQPRSSIVNSLRRSGGGSAAAVPLPRPSSGAGVVVSRTEEARRHAEASRETASELRRRFNGGSGSNTGRVGGAVRGPYEYDNNSESDSERFHTASGRFDFDADGFRHPSSATININGRNGRRRGNGNNGGRVFTGLLSAPVTPMDPRTGRADPSLIRTHYAELHRADGIDGVFCCGTTGESMSCTVQERMEAAQAWVESGLQVCVHVGAQSLLDTQALARHAQDIGADGIAVMVPVAVIKAGTLDHIVDYLFQVYRAAPEIPMLVYHFPTLTGYPYRLYDILRAGIAKIPTLRGAKHTSFDLADFTLCQSIGGQITDCIYSIEGNLIGAALIGAKAFVGMQFSMVGPLYREIAEAAARGDVARARAANARACDFMNKMAECTRGGSIEKAIAVTKYVVSLRLGRDCGECRAPGYKLSAQEKADVQRLLLPFCSENGLAGRSRQAVGRYSSSSLLQQQGRRGDDDDSESTARISSASRRRQQYQLLE